MSHTETSLYTLTSSDRFLSDRWASWYVYGWSAAD